MDEVSFSNLVVICAVAFTAPLVLGLAPSVRLPSVVLEIVAGIAIGPAGFGWVEVDEAVEVMALAGLAFLLFLAGLEIDPARLRGQPLRLAAWGFAMSVGLAVVAGYGLDLAGLAGEPLFVAVVLVSTSLGVIIPVLKDSGQTSSSLGQLVLAAASIADFGAIILLSVFFGGESSGTGAKLALIVGFGTLVAALAFALLRGERSMRISGVLVRLQDTTAQIRIRGAFLLLVALVALASELGLEVILGAFAAGGILTLVDRDQNMTHPDFRRKLEAVGFGVFIPVFFVASGVGFDLDALFASASTIAAVPAFLAALLLVRGLPAILFRPLLGTRGAVVAGLLQATSLPFIVAASEIGMELGLIDAGQGAGLIAAGLVSVLLFPLAALTLLGGAETSPAAGSSSPGTPQAARPAPQA